LCCFEDEEEEDADDADAPVLCGDAQASGAGGANIISRAW
jgi:hypothetical protein